MIYPMFAIVLLTAGVGSVTIYLRFTSVTRGLVSIKYFRTMSGAANVPEAMAKASRHFDNLFELPTLFYAACIVAMITNNTGETMQALAWAFVAARVAHAAIHLTYNNVVHRMVSFIAGFGAVMAMWVLLALA